MRGALYLRVPGVQDIDMMTTRMGHLLHFVHRRQRRVVRATFTGVLMGGCDTQDLGLLSAVIFHEMITGQVTAADARRLRDHGGLIIPMVLCIDA